MQVVRNVYKILPFKRPVFELLKKFVRPSENIYKHLYFQGDFSVQIDESHSFRIHHYGYELENKLFWGGLRNGWEKTSTSLWIQLVEHSDVIFDIGANTGFYSLIAKSLNPQAHVVAFEPLKRIFEKLNHNNRLNDFDILTLEFAASNANDVAIVYDTPTEHAYSVTVNQNLNPPSTEVIPTEIRIMRLDTLIEEMNIEKLDLIKLDVETHEPEVLEGLGKYLEKYRPTMLIEILNDEVGDRVEALVRGKNYLYFNIDERQDVIRRVERITKSDYYNYLICDSSVAHYLKLLN